jgi:multidrug efflux system outer membrane protein
MRNLLLLPMALVAGCNLAPTYERPIAPVAAEYLSAAPNVEGALPAGGLGWETYFHDPQLRALIELGLLRNRDLAQSLARIEQARARLRIQDSQRLPNVAIGGDGSRNRTPTSTLSAGSGTPGDGSSSGSYIDAKQYSVNVSVSAFELDFWGRLRNLSQAERLQYLASIEGARAARITLIANIASTYFDLRSGVARIALAEQALTGRREGVEIAKDRLDAGVTSTVDYDQAMQLLTQAESELAVVQRTTQQSRNLLDVLVGGPYPEELPSSLAFDAPQMSPIASGLPSELLASRPDILEAEYNLRAANANIGALRAQFFPSISLTGAYGYASPVLGNLVKGDNTSWSFGGAVNLPIFDWGRRRAELREGRSRADELVALYQRTTQGAFQEVADALVGRQRYKEQIEALTLSVEVQQRLVETARLRYENGISIYLEVLDAERTLFTSQQQLLQLRATALQNDVSLFAALGGGNLNH